MNLFRCARSSSRPSEGSSSSSSSATQPRFLAIFDFDLTLTKYHVWGRFKNAPLKEVPVNEAMFVDVEAFRTFVEAAKGRDAQVAIATFGRRDVVEKALRFLLGSDDHGVAVSTPADHFDPRFEFGDDDDRPRCAEGSDVLGDKNAQIERLRKTFGVTEDHNVFLADDDPNNVRAATNAGVFALHTPQGADKAVLDALLDRIHHKPSAADDDLDHRPPLK
mmetsp:Transcript_25361/g.82036  ORF Transcript_25361/g.82036 Transcript_25361/m.82036 type:complete len:220 (-) Transcript_25361:226-885(-)|eukprot:CAMPEP_0118912012 /NCGR_PEP_ID=MMETSP1166-20130328/13450_1 /TAXON_ID=1104430 /ORGANISM="Chrysoreinhardia sp, Strain CCMP3193" /LENGTH=219 /DNA_ID=CAMNT_0006851527 /DNA_START=126 /DNA_END=785 /DNA_ORIENTATION=+